MKAHNPVQTCSRDRTFSFDRLYQQTNGKIYPIHEFGANCIIN